MGLTKNLGWLSKYITADGSGNVGIGTVSSLRKLEVASDGSNWISGTFSGTGNTNKVVIGNLSTPTIGGHNAALNAWTDFTIAGDSIILAPFGSEKMRVNGTGNVLIGTTTDNGYKFDVNGASRIQGNLYVNDNSTTGNGIQLTAADRPLITRGWDAFTSGNKTGIGRWGVYMESATLVIGTPNVGGSGLVDFRRWNTDGTYTSTLSIGSTGNVGIGTGVPSSKVHIEGLFGTSGDAIRLQNTTGYTTGNRFNMDFWFKSAAWTNARTAQIAAVTTDSYWPNTDISFSTNANTSATALKEVMRVKQDGSVSNNGVLTQYISGGASVLNTFYFDFIAYPSTAYKVIAGITHWNAAYAAYKECVQFNDSYTNISELSITNHTSTAGGSWAISRPNNTTLRVTHNGGNYDGGANFWIQVIGV